MSPVPQRDAAEVGKILRRLGYIKDKLQLRQNGKKLKRMWRRVAASTVRQLLEAGQTPTSRGEVSDPPHVSSSFIEKEQVKEEQIALWPHRSLKLDLRKWVRARWRPLERTSGLP